MAIKGKVQVKLYLTEEARAELRAIARENYCSMSEVVEKLIMEEEV